ncbi:hemolysin III family protein [Heyndrickxia sporothermodurans]|uniref:Hemolysin III family protein n=1 Tax=Heyndrickxia sporothermodurans TaxID=46224 RepID=A0AB37HIW0_9BACI|nr:hemolysin III family protein [Heyndrickxia sporothermodurans]MBL5770334.1 hemolysin III family protein [Heyndrickxia sporothermodurans]MBL5773872.1 hemolysin III family protein [Heyndrickxia sporothermodurans]MBL5780821.1 hemolysin III family protein [Heyndrickxia sporothermodurans]MBL5797465.1 hemolysin III family protein [Heyndrickxia sporothermodurans]MBL5799683.1 hemolysin III family protein [Heyndrickxia sporothermodurans]
MAATHTFSKGEELANSITHGIGALLSVAGLVLLIIFSSLNGNAWHIISFTIYGITMLFLYMSSTLVHALREGKAKDVFEIFDHSAIYFFIAGTYTPYLLLIVKGWQGWTIFGIVWGLAILGTIFKCFFVKKYLFTSTILYIVMGWGIVTIWKPILMNLSQTGIILLVAGGLIYTIGSIFYMWRGFKYHHAIWHIFVMAGSACHFFGILLYL